MVRIRYGILFSNDFYKGNEIFTFIKASLKQIHTNDKYRFSRNKELQYRKVLKFIFSRFTLVQSRKTAKDFLGNDLAGYIHMVKLIKKVERISGRRHCQDISNMKHVVNCYAKLISKPILYSVIKVKYSISILRITDEKLLLYSNYQSEIYLSEVILGYIFCMGEAYIRYDDEDDDIDTDEYTTNPRVIKYALDMILYNLTPDCDNKLI
jgi:hypothetical protein